MDQLSLNQAFCEFEIMIFCEVFFLKCEWRGRVKFKRSSSKINVNQNIWWSKRHENRECFSDAVIISICLQWQKPHMHLKQTDVQFAEREKQTYNVCDSLRNNYRNSGGMCWDCYGKWPWIKANTAKVQWGVLWRFYC